MKPVQNANGHTGNAGGSTTSAGDSSYDGVASMHGPRADQMQDSGWKKIQVEPKKAETGCGCTIL